MKSGVIDPFYAGQVLSDLLSRQWARKVELILTPKDSGETASDDNGGG